MSDTKTVGLELELYNTVISRYYGLFRLCSKCYSCNSNPLCHKEWKQIIYFNATAIFVKIEMKNIFYSILYQEEHFLFH